MRIGTELQLFQIEKIGMSQSLPLAKIRSGAIGGEKEALQKVKITFRNASISAGAR